MNVMSYPSDREMMISVVNSVQDVELALHRYDFKCPIISYVIMWDELCDLYECLWMCWAAHPGLSFIIVRCVLHELRLLLPGV